MVIQFLLNMTTLNTALSSTTAPFNFQATISNSTGLGVVTVQTLGTSSKINLIPKKFNGTTTLTNTGIYKVTNINGTIQIS